MQIRAFLDLKCPHCQTVQIAGIVNEKKQMLSCSGCGQYLSYSPVFHQTPNSLKVALEVKPVATVEITDSDYLQVQVG